jgi:hypothetical protein
MAAIELLKEVETPGITEFPEPSGKNCYGISYNRTNGSLTIVRNSGGSMMRLKDDVIISSGDYASVVWSDKLLLFSFPPDASSAIAGHLQVEIV